jgi:hypothetical protein
MRKLILFPLLLLACSSNDQEETKRTESPILGYGGHGESCAFGRCGDGLSCVERNVYVLDQNVRQRDGYVCARNNDAYEAPIRAACITEAECGINPVVVCAKASQNAEGRCCAITDRIWECASP